MQDLAGAGVDIGRTFYFGLEPDSILKKSNWSRAREFVDRARTATRAMLSIL